MVKVEFKCEGEGCNSTEGFLTHGWGSLPDAKDKRDFVITMDCTFCGKEHYICRSGDVPGGST